MRRVLALIIIFNFQLSIFNLFAQSLNVKQGYYTWQFPAAYTGDITYTNGSSVNVMGHSFTLSDVDKMSVLTTKCGIKLNFQTAGYDHVEIESVDANSLVGDGQYIIDFYCPDGETFTVGKDYYVNTLPCDVSSGYRLTIYKDASTGSAQVIQKADYYDVHQKIEAGAYITPSDLVESDLEFVDLDAPFVEDERPGLNAQTKAALVAYQKNPTEENKQNLMTQMGIKYDKVVARKKAKLRQLEREAKTQSLIDEMQAIVDEMTENRDIRLEQQFYRLIDPRTDDDTTDEWLVLHGAAENNAYIGYAPVRNVEYAKFKAGYSYASGQDNYPVVNITYAEAVAYCNWLSSSDTKHSYRLPSEEEWILAAGHMPKDVSMNSDHVEKGLTAVDAYSQTTGACGGIDFWGNCWEWTSTVKVSDGFSVSSGNVEYIVKGGSWDSSRDACRTEYSNDARDGSKGYSNVGFRVVRVDK